MGFNISAIFRSARDAVAALFAGPEPDPALDLVSADRITTDYYPVSNEPGTRYERYYAEKQANGLLFLRFQSTGGDGFVSNALADGNLNRAPFPCDLTLEQAYRHLKAYDSNRRKEVGADCIAAPESDLHFTRVPAILRSLVLSREAAAKPSAPSV